jgi:DNA-binding CsgD family transcriptional regulator
MPDPAGTVCRASAAGTAARLRRDEVRRVDRALGETAAADSVGDLLTLALVAVDEHLGYSTSAFMLAIAAPPLPGARAYAGVTHGFEPYVAEEYFERWCDRDPLASDAGRLSFLHSGRASLADLYPMLDEPRRRFVDDFLRRIRARHQLSHRLPGGWSDGYLTVMRTTEFAERDQRVLGALSSRLSEQLAALLPRGLSCGLSVREAQVAELVALGFANQEIAGVLHVEEDTVKKHVSRAMGKLGIRRRSALAVTWATGHSLGLDGMQTSPARARSSTGASRSA